MGQAESTSQSSFKVGMGVAQVPAGYSSPAYIVILGDFKAEGFIIQARLLSYRPTTESKY